MNNDRRCTELTGFRDRQFDDFTRRLLLRSGSRGHRRSNPSHFSFIFHRPGISVHRILDMWGQRYT